MSDLPNELPPIRVGQANPWSGLPAQDAAPPGRPLTYGERDVLRAFLRFRDRIPPQSWLLLRGAVNGALLLVVFGVFVGLLWGGAYFFVALDAERTDYGGDTDTGRGALIAVTAWLGLTYGFLVRDQIDLRRTVAAWHIVQRVIRFDAADRLLETGMLPPDANDGAAKEMHP